jgi:hypothetical protein
VCASQPGHRYTFAVADANVPFGTMALPGVPLYKRDDDDMVSASQRLLVHVHLIVGVS